MGGGGQCQLCDAMAMTARGWKGRVHVGVRVRFLCGLLHAAPHRVATILDFRVLWWSFAPTACTFTAVTFQKKKKKEKGRMSHEVALL